MNLSSPGHVSIPWESMGGQTMDNGELVERARNGDAQAFALAVRTDLPRVRNLIRYRLRDPEDRDDALQETFLRAWRSIHTLREPARLGAWLVRIAATVCSETIRARQRGPLSRDPQRLDDLMTRYGRWARDDFTLSTAVRESLAKVREGAREAAVLFYLRGMRIREIAQATSRPEGTVKRLLHTARESLRAMWDEESGQGGPQ